MKRERERESIPCATKEQNKKQNKKMKRTEKSYECANSFSHRINLDLEKYCLKFKLSPAKSQK